MDVIEQPKTLDDLARNLALFNKDHLPYGMPQLEMSKPYVLDRDWPQQWPGATCAGVYVFLDGANHILYVGKASCNSNLGYRLGAHFMYGPDNKCKPKSANAIAADPAAVAAIPIPDLDRTFEAAALEEFLIHKLDPPFNTFGRPVANAT